MNKMPFTTTVEGEMIHCIVETSLSAEQTVKPQAIVFLHGWGGYRVGPHDLFVKFTKRLTELGYTCIRFDFRGRGYSGSVDFQPSTNSMLCDLESVLLYINYQLKIEDISLLGICSGAKLALYYAMTGSVAIKHVIEMSSPPLRIDEGGQQIALRRMKVNLVHYLKKMGERTTWNKIVQRQIHYDKILVNLFAPIKKAFRYKANTVKKGPISMKGTKAFRNFHGAILLIHAEKDPETILSMKQIILLLRKYNINYTTHIIANANHSFYAKKWEDEIFNILTQWMWREE